MFKLILCVGLHNFFFLFLKGLIFCLVPLFSIQPIWSLCLSPLTNAAISVNLVLNHACEELNEEVKHVKAYGTA